jgi:hypothetical protein
VTSFPMPQPNTKNALAISCENSIGCADDIDEQQERKCLLGSTEYRRLARPERRGKPA